MAAPHHRFLFLSHSFGRRLKTYCDNNPGCGNLGMSWDYVNIVGSLGPSNISYLRHAVAWLQIRAPLVATVDVSCICLGHNDIVESYANRPRQLADDIFQLAMDLHNAGSKRVVIIPVLFRRGLAAVPRPLQANASPSDIMQAEYDYQQQVIVVNQRLKELCDSSDVVSFHSLRGLIQNWRHKLLNDGCHLRPPAMRTFFNNVRSAFIVEKGRLNN